MANIRAFLKRKDIVFSAKRYGIDALGAMAQGLFCTLLVGTILNTIGQQLNIGFLNAAVVTIKDAAGANQISYTIGGPKPIRNKSAYMRARDRQLDQDGAAPVYPTGTRVRHAAFGEGAIVSYDSDRRAYEVKFDGMETTRTIAARTKLQAL